MTDDPRDDIRRLSLWADETDNDARELRAGMIDRWGRETVERLEDIILNAPDSGDGDRRLVDGIETNGSAALLSSDLGKLVSSGRLAYTQDAYTFREPSKCADAALRGEPDLPVYSSPPMLGNAAWVDVCMPTADWVRLMISPFDTPPARSLIGGLAPSSVERVREGLQSGANIPRGALEMERRRVGSATFLAPKSQEGRNRGVAALLEGYDTVLGRLIVTD